jgi:hypothetical protein
MGPFAIGVQVDQAVVRKHQMSYHDRHEDSDE